MNHSHPARVDRKRARFAKGALIAAIAVIGVASGFGFEATAQSKKDVRDMAKKIEQLEKQLNAVQRKVFPGGAASRDGQTVVVTEDRTASSQALLADMEVRIGRIETQLRILTGRIEEFQHGQDVIKRRFDNFSQDVELRFQDLQGGTSATAQPGAGVTGSRSVTSPGLVRTETPAAAEALLNTGTVPDAVMIETAPQIFATPQEQYDGALALLRRGDYAGAEGAFRAFLDSHGDHELAGNAQYWLGESYYVRKDFPRAASAFLKGYQKFGEGGKGPDTLVKLGMSLGGMGKVAEACDLFSEVEVRFPDARASILRTATSERVRLGCS